MSEVKRAITDAMRQRIYEMWIAGYKVANIAADIGTLFLFSEMRSEHYAKIHTAAA